jgi:hypothetical protein
MHTKTDTKMHTKTHTKRHTTATVSFLVLPYLCNWTTKRNNHRYRKSLNRLLKVCYVPATSAVLVAFFSYFFAAAINSTNEANKAAGTRH